MPDTNTTKSFSVQDPARRIADLFRGRASLSQSRAGFLLGAIVFLLFITVVALYIAPDIAKKDVEVAEDVVDSDDGPANKAVKPIHLNGIASCGETAVTVGDDGGIAISKDQGRSWDNIEVAVNRDLLAVSFSGDCSHIVAAGDRGTLVQSSDEGSSWTIGAQKTTNRIRSVAIDDYGLTSVAVGHNGLFIVSNDGMRTSQKVLGLRDEVGVNVELSDDGRFAIVNTRRGSVHVFRKDEAGTFNLLSKYDGGDTDFGVAVVTDYSGDALKASIFGENRAILSYAGPNQWSYTNRPDTSDRREIVDVVVHGDKLLAVGDDGLYMTSVDGSRWNHPNSVQGNDLTSVAMNESGTVAAAVGEDGTVLVALTEQPWWAGPEGEPHWNFVDIGVTSELLDVTFVSNDRFLAVGEKMRVIGDVERTSLHICEVSMSAGSKIQTMCVRASDVGKVIVEEDTGSRAHAYGAASEYSDDAGADEQTARGRHWWADERLLSIIQNNVIRLGTITLFMFIASHLFRLTRYHFRLAAYYQARADALDLVDGKRFSGPVDVSELERTMLALSPDHLEATTESTSSTGATRPIMPSLPLSG